MPQLDQNDDQQLELQQQQQQQQPADQEHQTNSDQQHQEHLENEQVKNEINFGKNETNANHAESCTSTFNRFVNFSFSLFEMCRNSHRVFRLVCQV